MTKLQISESDIVEQPQPICDFVYVAEKADRFPHGHIQHVVNILSAITYVEDLLLETRPLTFFADEFDVGEKLHLDGDRAVALTDFTTSARNVEGKVRRIEAARLRFARVRECLANCVVDFDVGDRIRPGRATDRRLIDQDHIIDILCAFEFLKRTNMPLPVTLFFFQAGVDAIVNQSRFA